MYKYILTIDYDNLRNIFDDYNDEEIKTLYDKYNGVSLFKKNKEEIKEFDIKEFLIFQNQLRCIYQKDPEIFSDQNITEEVMQIITNKKDATDEQLKQLKQTIGVGSISTSKSSTSLVDVTIVIGKDFEE